jgi:glycosyltransferase involved in cell wall biosynthesis
MASWSREITAPHPRTGLIVYGLDRHLGGIGRYTEELAAALDRIGAGPVVLHAGSRPAGADGRALPGARLLPGLLTLGQAEIGWLARRHGLRVIHDPTGCMPLLLTGARRVATVHDVIPYVFPETSTRLDWLIYHIWLPLAVRRVDVVITDSTVSKSGILRFLRVKPEKVSVIPLAANARYRPLDPEAIRPALARYRVEPPYILYVGSLESRKNLPRLLEAYARLRELLPAWTLVIVGARKWKFTPIFETVRRLALEPHVHFTGFVEEADLPALYNGADLFAFPSLYEGFGLPVLEAMACGTPVVTSNTSSLPEVAGDAALLVDPTDVEAIAAAMARVLTDPALAQEMRGKGLAQASQFTWERTARETLAVYETVLRGSNLPPRARR